MPSPLALKAKLFRLAAGIVATMGMTITLAYAGVGVTSETNGDPLGRPPAEAERVLRVGIDIKANEVITTKADDRAHIVFLDGTSLTVAPNAQLVIDKFVYDPNTKKGELAVSVSKGVLRLVGGKISKNNPISVRTSSATIGIRGGIGLFIVDPNETKANFLFGTSMTVSANGQTQTATRPGSEIATKLGAAPGAPSIIRAGALSNALATLEGRTGKGNRKPDEAAKESGFSSNNSEQALGVGLRPSDSGDENDAALGATSNAGVERQGATRPSNASGTVTFVNAAPQSPASPAATPTPSPSAVPPIIGFAPAVPPAPPGSPLPLPVIPIPASPTGPSSGPPPPALPPPPQSHRATPAIGVGNGGLVPAIPASPSGQSSGPPPPALPPPPQSHRATPAIGVGNGGLVPAIPASQSGQSSGPPPPTSPPPSPPVKPHGATPAIGVGHGGLVPAIPASPTHPKK